MKTLHVQVYSGLGSRMRAVVAAIAWGKLNNADITVHWPWNDPSERLGVFPAIFHDLFESPLSSVTMPGPDRTWPKEITEKGGGWLIRTCEPETVLAGTEPPDGWPYAELWQPSELVQEQVDLIDWPQGRVVGVHIRHSLAQPSTPPLAWFLGRMRELYDRHSVRFFLSCDTKQVERAVTDQFPDTLHLPRTYDYDRMGIARAAADLFLLARCDWMVGSYNSSFSELAGWLRGGKYLPGWGREGWMPGGSYEDARTPPNASEFAAWIDREQT